MFARILEVQKLDTQLYNPLAIILTSCVTLPHVSVLFVFDANLSFCFVVVQYLI